MKRILGLTTAISSMMISSAWAEQPLYVAYPPPNHKTTSDRIFFIGTAAPDGDVSINGQIIQRSQGGHFAPTLPLELGENTFIISYKNQKIKLNITRTLNQPPTPNGITFIQESLTPSTPIAILPGELICFSAIAPPNAQVSVKLGEQTLPLFAQSQGVDLPDNKAVLTGENQPINSVSGKYQGCATISTNLDLLG